MLVNRKRPRLSSVRSSREHITPHAQSYRDLEESITSLASPSPLVNTQYRLAGGLDTPGRWDTHIEELAQMHDVDSLARTSRFDCSAESTAYPSIWRRAAANFGEDPVSRSTSLTGLNLRKGVWAVTGGLAGKIFNFCWNTAFTGFSAGRGQAYDATGHPKESDYAQDDEPVSGTPRRKVPGHYPHSRNVSDVQDHATVEKQLYAQTSTTPDPAANNSWVLVEHESESSPVRKKARASTAGGGKFNETGEDSPSRTASYASSRSVLANGAFFAQNRHSLSPVAFPRAKARRTTSIYTSPTKRQSSYHVSSTSLHSSSPVPISPEVQQYQRKRRREDRKQDQSFVRLNAQLQDMIREGQQALGNKIEVFGGHGSHQGFGEEGYFDDDYG